MKKKSVFLTILFIFLFSISTVWAGVPEMANKLMQAYSNNQVNPVLSQTNPEMDIKMAYEVQKAYVSQRLANDFIVGFKAGFTNAAVQKKYGVGNEPAAGVLYGKGMYFGSPIIEYSGPPGLIIETEIGFVIGETITSPLKDVAEFKTKVTDVMPVIELPNMGFTNMKVLKGIDVIAANVAADRSIAGQRIKVGDIDLNGLDVTLYQNGKLIRQGKGADALGDQWQTALWIANMMVKQGYEIRPGHILITGALGKVAPALPGHYEAFWGPLGKITFDIK